MHTVGYKSPAGKEMDLDVAARAGLLVTDSPEQVAAFGRRFILHDTPYLDRLKDLGGIVSGRTPLEAEPEDIRVCYPVGFSGSEVVVADDILRRYKAAAE